MSVTYPDMNSLLKDDFSGEFRLEHFEIKPDNYRAIYRDMIPVGTYVVLRQSGQVVMSNTPMEKRTNDEFVENAHGHVLIGGLGIGMVLLAIQDDPEVESITVVEKNREVLDIIQPQLKLNSKVRIVHADIFEYEPDMKYNTIWIDIWNTIDSDVYQDEMVPLMNKYRKHLVSKSSDPRRYINCWAKLNAKYDKPLV